MTLDGLKGRVALVTGAAGGVGRATVAALHAAGAKVVATDLRVPATDEAMWLALDVTDAAAVREAVALAERELGPLALVVHAAGVLSTTPIIDTPPEEWARVIGINAGGTFNVLSAAGKAMAAHGKGAVVVVSSNAAGIPRMNMGAYAASKAAATMLTRCAGLELAAKGIRCNIIAPGSTLTPMQTGMWADDQGAARVIAGDPANFKAGIPLGKLATPEDIAAAALFLLSDQAGHITMTDLYIDGGATMRG